MSEPPPTSLPFGAVILAAGRSRRMGTPKMLLPWADTSVIGHLLAVWLRLAVRQVAVVCATEDTLLQTELDRLAFPAANRIFNPAPERGMFHSIQCAAAWTSWQPQLTHWAIALGDQPHLRVDTLSRLLQFASERQAQVCQPSFKGRPRHPVIVAKQLFLDIANSQCATLKDFLEKHLPIFCELNDPGLNLDMDEPEDYRRLTAKIKG